MKGRGQRQRYFNCTLGQGDHQEAVLFFDKKDDEGGVC
jgi:hypothetical protein